jgi:outer membrane beta-barrel protein
MEIRFRSFFLSLLIVFCNTLSVVEAAAESDQQSLLIQPDIQRQQFDEALINADDFEVILALGYLSIEDFGVNSLSVARLNYHVNEDVFLQMAYGQSKGGNTSYEVLSAGAPLFTDAERELTYYSINIGYNLLPGEAFLTESSAHNTAFYLSAGIGVTEFAGENRFTINYGTGYRFLLNDSWAMTVDFRNNQFDMNVFGESQPKATNNLEFTFGISWIF